MKAKFKGLQSGWGEKAVAYRCMGDVGCMEGKPTPPQATALAGPRRHMRGNPAPVLGTQLGNELAEAFILLRFVRGYFIISSTILAPPEPEAITAPQPSTGRICSGQRRHPHASVSFACAFPAVGSPRSLCRNRCPPFRVGSEWPVNSAR